MGHRYQEHKRAATKRRTCVQKRALLNTLLNITPILVKFGIGFCELTFRLEN
jgi:hypothetical protein